MATKALKTVEQVLDEKDAEQTLSADLVAAFAEIEGAAKDKVNPHFKSKYADIASVIDAIKPVLARYRLAFYQRSQPSEDGVLVQTMLRHVSGEEIDLGTLYVPANKRDAQGFGSALTYARRYALMTAFGVPAEDDDGNAASRSNDHPTEGESRPTNRDDPFPQGPARNKTQLKDMGRVFWRDVEACGDSDELEILLADKDNRLLVKQLMEALPSWWDGGMRNGEAFEGLEAVIARKRRDFEQLETVNGR
jgi:hypothetical protein